LNAPLTRVSSLVAGAAIKRAVYASRPSVPQLLPLQHQQQHEQDARLPLNVPVASLNASAQAASYLQSDRVLSLLQRRHARARSEAFARTVLLLWHQSAAASRCAAAAAAEYAASQLLSDVRLQGIAEQLAASAEAQRKRLQESLISSFRSLLHSTNPLLYSATSQSPSLQTATSSSRPSRSSFSGVSGLKLNEFSNLNFDSTLLQRTGTPARGAQDYKLHVRAAGDGAVTTAVDAALDPANSEGLQQRSFDASDDFIGGDEEAALRRLMRQFPFVWLVLRRAAWLWHRRHAGDFRVIGDLRKWQQKLRHLHHQEKQQWQEQQQQLLKAVSAADSALLFERFQVNAGEKELEECRDAMQRACRAADGFEHELKLARNELKMAAAAEKAASAQTADLTALLQAAKAEQMRLKETVAVHGMRSTMLMQEQLRLLQQLDDAKTRGRVAVRYAADAACCGGNCEYSLTWLLRAGTLRVGWNCAM
jgi:hypothetical protein